MPKIFSVLTLLVALGATFLGFQSKALVETLQAKGKETYDILQTTKATLKKTEDELKATKEELAMTKEELEKTKENLRTKEKELETTKAELTATMTMLEESKAKLAELQKIIDSMPKPVEGKGLKEQIEEMQKKVVDLEAKTQTLEKEKAELETIRETLTAQKKEQEEKIVVQTKVIKKYKDGIMEKGVRGRVLAVNAGWGFCVLSIGDNQGAAANRIMVVARGGQAIGRVKITTVEATQAVADIIVSSFQKGVYIQPGDDVIYTGDDKVKIEQIEGAGGGAPVGGNQLPPPPQLPIP